ncbi:MAG: single-stranded DNA-binding protein [Lentimicrobiaceae bacterium]|jgi:single-strand DNA-binding protein|nr:single-stranded DNA-binding protein [Lentimicrobiaceae bacterium]
MAGLNKVMLIGRLGKDPEIISFENGSRKMTTTLATSERFRDRNGQWQEQTEWHNTEWHNLVAWGPLANDIAEKRRNYIKGDLMYIEGKIKSRQYLDSNGQNRYITEIVIERMSLIAPRKDAQSGNEPYGGSTYSTYNQTASQQPQNATPVTEEPPFLEAQAQVDDDLPF